MTKYDIKHQKAMKDYECLSCARAIPKRTMYYSLQKWSHWMVEQFERVTGYHPLARKTVYEVYVPAKFCSKECHDKFLHRRRKGKEYEFIRKRWRKLVGDAYERRLPKWEKLTERELEG